MGKKKTSGCGQTSIPRVDNTELPCENYIYEDCIRVRQAIPTFGIRRGESFRNAMAKIEHKVQSQSRLIKQLRSELKNLQDKNK